MTNGSSMSAPSSRGEHLEPVVRAKPAGAPLRAQHDFSVECDGHPGGRALGPEVPGQNMLDGGVLGHLGCLAVHGHRHSAAPAPANRIGEKGLIAGGVSPVTSNSAIRSPVAGVSSIPLR